MKHCHSKLQSFLMTLAGIWLIAVSSNAEGQAVDSVAQRKESKFKPMPAMVVGVVVMNPTDMLSRENRSGPKEGACFSYNGDSYRWFFVPSIEKSGEEYSFGIGDDSKKRTKIPNLLPAMRESLAEQGLTADYVLVEMTVNGGRGSSAEENFAATEMKILDGSRRYPIRPESVVRKLTKMYQSEFKARKDIGHTFDDLRRSVAKDVQELIGPNSKRLKPAETTQCVYVTWLPKTEQLRVEFLSRVYDAYYVYSKGIVPAKKDTADRGIQYGIEYGVETGRIYEISKLGNVASTESVPLKTFVKRIAPPGSPKKQQISPAK